MDNDFFEGVENYTSKAVNGVIAFVLIVSSIHHISINLARTCDKLYIHMNPGYMERVDNPKKYKSDVKKDTGIMLAPCNVNDIFNPEHQTKRQIDIEESALEARCLAEL